MITVMSNDSSYEYNKNRCISTEIINSKKPDNKL